MLAPHQSDRGHYLRANGRSEIAQSEGNKSHNTPVRSQDVQATSASASHAKPQLMLMLLLLWMLLLLSFVPSLSRADLKY